MDPNRQAYFEKAGYDLGDRFAKVFVIREDAQAADIQRLGLQMAEWRGDVANQGLEAGAAFIGGFANAIQGQPRSARSMTVEEKLDAFLSQELRDMRQEIKALKAGKKG